ncbi:MAG: cell division protein, partial [Noviherbaspirillum sp.]|nr:cell division protein [Noviherbaspirillum sp.]
MTDLQASLMAIGGTIVVGVITYNKWQEYKAKKTVEKAFSSDHDDVLMKAHADPVLPSAGRQEPSFDSGTAEHPAHVVADGDESASGESLPDDDPAHETKPPRK